MEMGMGMVLTEWMTVWNCITLDCLEAEIRFDLLVGWVWRWTGHIMCCFLMSE